MKFEHTPREMAEKLMEFIRDISDDEQELKYETEYMTEVFEKLQMSAEYNALVNHLDLMFMDSIFDLE